MTALENIVLRDRDNGYVKEINAAQKIKLRDSSYATISIIYLTSPSTDMSTIIKEDTATDIAEVMILLPIAEILKILEKVETEGSKALKVKPSMYANISDKGAHVEDTDKKFQFPVEHSMDINSIATENSEEVELVSTQEIPQSEEASEENIRISRNGAAMAKVERYTAMPHMEESENAATATSENSVLPPTMIEEQSARPVSREIPVVSPIRENKTEENEKELETVTDSTLNPENITSVMIDLGQLREYLAKTAELKRAAQQAKEEEMQARAAAERAEQEAASTRDKLRKTAEEFAVHQQNLIAQTEQSQEQATLYDAMRNESLAEKAEYEEAISDMLAVMGTATTVNSTKERVM